MGGEVMNFKDLKEGDKVLMSTRIDCDISFYLDETVSRVTKTLIIINQRGTERKFYRHNGQEVGKPYENTLKPFNEADNQRKEKQAYDAFQGLKSFVYRLSWRKLSKDDCDKIIDLINTIKGGADE